MAGTGASIPMVNPPPPAPRRFVDHPPPPPIGIDHTPLRPRRPPQTSADVVPPPPTSADAPPHRPATPHHWAGKPVPSVGAEAAPRCHCCRGIVRPLIAVTSPPPFPPATFHRCLPPSLFDCRIPRYNFRRPFILRIRPPPSSYSLRRHPHSTRPCS